MKVRVTHSQWAYGDVEPPLILKGGEHELENVTPALATAIAAAAAAGGGIEILETPKQLQKHVARAVEPDEVSLAFQAKCDAIRAELLPQRDAAIADGARRPSPRRSRPGSSVRPRRLRGRVMPSDDTSTSGGAIDTLRRIDFTQIARTTPSEAVSSAAGDTTQTLTITGRKADGSIVSETLTLNGTTIVVTTINTVRAAAEGRAVRDLRRHRHRAPAAPARRPIRTIPIGERGFMAIFRSSSDPSVQVKDFYCKFFWKNTNGDARAAPSPVVENADPSAQDHARARRAVDASTSVANRVDLAGLHVQRQLEGGARHRPLRRLEDRRLAQPHAARRRHRAPHDLHVADRRPVGLAPTVSPGPSQ
jgi:hypothetical protein